MAKQNIDNLMKEAVKVASDTWARSGVDKSKQLVTVTDHNLREAFKEAFSKSHQKEFPGKEIPFSDPDAVFRKAGNAAREALIEHLKNPRTGSSLHKDTAKHKVVFTQERAIRSPFRIMKQAGANYLNKELKKVGAKPLSDKQHQDINLGMQRLHQGVTVGVARLKKVIDMLEGAELGSKFFSSEIGITFVRKFGDVLAKFELVKVGGKDTIRYVGDVNVLVQRKGKNFAGSDHNDWKKVSEHLNKALAKWLKSKDIARIPGSKTVEQESIELTEMRVMQQLTKGAFVKAITPIKNAKSTSKKGSSKKLSNKVSSDKNVKARVATKVRATESNTSDLLRLIVQINRELPDTVRKNMKEPALVNRTGRFAESVRLTDVVQTPKGYPSFGYTYQRDPYQVFEEGSSGNWSNGNRDPRDLIDKSIREIAAQFAIGRFYTRRV